MRFTIERIRTLVLAAGVLLIVAIAGFLAVGRWKHLGRARDLPQRLGIDIRQEANGVTYTQAHGGHTIFKIHASRVIELKNDHATLHGVEIELYGRNEATVDRIRGDEFDYDNKTGTATAAGPVEITLEQPASPAGQKSAGQAAEGPRARNEIHVKTSGLVFDQRSGMVTTNQRVEFSAAEASGSAVGASYDSDRDLLVLDNKIELTAHPAGSRGQTAQPVELRARHAEFDRDGQIVHLDGASAATSVARATAVHAQIAVRDDGTVESLQASGGFTLASSAGDHLAAPAAAMQFNQRNQPQHGRLTGGVKLSSTSGGREVDGTAPTMELAFNAVGELRHVHMERDVVLTASESGLNAQAEPVDLTRTWRSPVADLDLRQAARGKLEPATIQGHGGVVVREEARAGNAPAASSLFAADDVTGRFGPDSSLTEMRGTGHARIEQTASTGARQTASGDQLQARFTPIPAQDAQGNAKRRGVARPADAPVLSGGGQIQSAVLHGHVVLVDQPAPRPGAAAESPLRATADRAEFESAGQWLHLTGNPRLHDSGMDLTADRLDFAQAAGEAFAHGNVKATWIEAGPETAREANPVTLGGHGPAHAVAAEAEFRQASGEATFRGNARLWQQDDSISAPLIALNRAAQSLVAKAAGTAKPVTVVLLSAAGSQSPAQAGSHRAATPGTPAVVRVRGGDLWYSSAERKAVLRAAPLDAVTVRSGAVESTSRKVELFLAPGGAALNRGSAAMPAQVERMIASGHVALSSQGRRGTGEQLTYASRTGEYVLSGTASEPPRLRDPERGNVTGSALIFNSRNDSVSIEGQGQETMTETTVPR